MIRSSLVGTIESPGDLLPGDQSSWVAGALLAAGTALITITLLRRWAKGRRRSAQRDREALDRRPAAPPVARPADRAAADGVMVEMQELTRECAAQIDNRARRIETLLAEADDTIARLEALLRDLPDHAAVSPAERVEEPEEDPLADRVRALAAMGRSPVEIARELDEQVGKVQLILALGER